LLKKFKSMIFSVLNRLLSSSPKPFLLALAVFGTSAAQAQTQTFDTPPYATTTLGFSGNGSYFTTTGGLGFGAYGVSAGSATITSVERTIPKGTAAGSLFSFDLANPVGNFNTSSCVQVLLNIDRAGFVQELKINSNINAGSYAFKRYTGNNDVSGAVNKIYAGSSSNVTVVATSGSINNQRPVSNVTIKLPAALATAGKRVQVQIVLTAVTGAKLLIDNVSLLLADGITPLPVELTRFDATVKGQSVNVSWATASEKNNDHFDIQRSATGGEYNTIGTAKGQGSTTMANNYSFLDSRPLAGASYYRLRQVDTDGTFSFSPVVAVQTGASTKVMLYPNPSANQLILPAGVGMVQYRIFNALGQTLLSGQATDNDRLDITSLPKGPFFLELSGATGHYTQRLMRQ
jgi:hypothetical protein